tara:strand:- start:275 stop:511 length:237 start_codon:yes stop_codon:yes gene_type:complete
MTFDEEKIEVGDLYRFKKSCFIVTSKYNPIHKKDIVIYNLYFIRDREFQGNTKLFQSSIRTMFQHNKLLEVSRCPKRK